MPTWSSEQKARAIFSPPNNAWRKSQYLLVWRERFYSGFHIKLGIILNIFELDWFNSEMFASNILILEIAQIHIFILMFKVFAFVQYSIIEWRNIKCIRNSLVRQKGGWHFHYTLTNNKSTKANLVLVNRRQIFLKIVKEYISKYKQGKVPSYQKLLKYATRNVFKFT